MHCIDFKLYDFVDQPVFVLVPDEKNRPVYAFANRIALGHLGLQLDEIVGRRAYDIFSGRAAYSVFRRQCAAWEGGHHTEYEIALPIGNDHMWVRTSLVPVRDEDGTLTHMVGTSQNITPERDQLQVQAMSTAAAREMEDMVCLAAHDLRSPIGNLKTLAEVMRRDFVDHGDGKLELVNMIDNIADKALNVVSGIMAQALTTSGPQCSQLFDFGELCDDVLVLLDPMRVHSAVYPRIEIDADYTVVHIILRNLIDNALKYAGRPEVQLQIDITQMNAQRLLIAVRDNGQGFGQTLMELGDLDDGVSVGAGGFGLLGVRRLARSRGGKVSVMPCMNGAEVQFELPGRIAIPCAAKVMTA